MAETYRTRNPKANFKLTSPADPFLSQIEADFTDYHKSFSHQHSAVSSQQKAIWLTADGRRLKADNIGGIGGVFFCI
jgi:hypothetical protein